MQRKVGVTNTANKSPPDAEINVHSAPCLLEIETHLLIAYGQRFTRITYHLSKTNALNPVAARVGHLRHASSLQVKLTPIQHVTYAGSQRVETDDSAIRSVQCRSLRYDVDVSTQQIRRETSCESNAKITCIH